MTTDGQDAGLAALGDRTRRDLVGRLADGPLSVGELADTVSVSRPAVSQHLRVLKDAGLVSERAEGTRRIYRLEPAGLEALRDQLDTFWRRALESYGTAVDDAKAASDELESATRGPNVSPVAAPGSAATQTHVLFPNEPAPHSEHNGQGKKGTNEQPHPNMP